MRDQAAAQRKAEAVARAEELGVLDQGEGGEGGEGGGDAGEGGAAKPDAAPTDAPEGEKKDEPGGPKAAAWATFNHQQKEHVRKQQAFAREREQFAQEKAQIQAQLNAFEEVKRRAKDDPFEALKFVGHEDGKKFIEWVAENGSVMTPERRKQYDLEQKVARMEKEREDALAQHQQMRAQQEAQQNIDRVHRDIAEYIQKTPEFADTLVAAPGTEGAVLQVMREHYEQSGEEMQYRDAVKQVQQTQEKRIKGLLDELVSNKRGLAMFNEIASKLNPPAQARKQAPSGITSRIANNTGNTGSATGKPVSFEDKLAAAKARMDSKYS